MVVDRSYFYLEFRVTVTANANFYLLYNWVGEGEPQLWVGVSTSDAALAPAVGGCQHLRCGPGPSWSWRRKGEAPVDLLSFLFGAFCSCPCRGVWDDRCI